MFDERECERPCSPLVLSSPLLLLFSLLCLCLCAPSSACHACLCTICVCTRVFIYFYTLSFFIFPGVYFCAFYYTLLYLCLFVLYIIFSVIFFHYPFSPTKTTTTSSTNHCTNSCPIILHFYPARLLCHLSSPPSLLLPGLLAPLRVVLKEICLASDLCHRLVRCLAQRVRTLWLGE